MFSLASADYLKCVYCAGSRIEKTVMYALALHWTWVLCVPLILIHAFMQANCAHRGVRVNRVFYIVFYWFFFYSVICQWFIFVILLYRVFRSFLWFHSTVVFYLPNSHYIDRLQHVSSLSFWHSSLSSSLQLQHHHNILLMCNTWPKEKTTQTGQIRSKHNGEYYEIFG